MMLHLPAIAKEAGIEFSIFDIDRLSDETPLVSKIKPSGQHTLYDFDQAGGVGKVIKILSKKQEADYLTVNGKTHQENVEKYSFVGNEVIHDLNHAYEDYSSLVVLKGNLSPNGCVVKRSDVSKKMLVHTGPAHCFECEEDAVNVICDK